MAGILNSIGAGLSAAGGAVAQFGNDAGVMALKSQLEDQSMRLASQLRTQEAYAAPGATEAVQSAQLNLARTKAQLSSLGITLDDQGNISRTATPTNSNETTTAPAQSSGSAASASSSSPVQNNTKDNDVVISGGGKAPAITASMLPPGMSVETAQWLALNAPDKLGEAVAKSYEPQQLREHSSLEGRDPNTGAYTELTKNYGTAHPLTDADRQNFGLKPTDSGYIDENGEPHLLKSTDQPLSNVGKLKADLDAGRISQGEYQTELGKIGNTSQLTDDAKREAALYYIQNGKMPVSTRNRADTDAVMNYVATLKPQGVSDSDWMKGLQNNALALHAKMMAAGTVGRQQAVTAVNEDTVTGAGNILNGLLKKGVAGPTNVTDANAALQWLGRKMNNADDVNLQNAIQTYSNEYARVMTGATTGAPSSDSARAEAATRLLKGYNSGTLQAAMKQMNQEMGNRSESYKNAMQQLTGGYSGVTPSATPESEIAPNSGNGGQTSAVNNEPPLVKTPADARKLPGNIPTFMTPDGRHLKNPNYTGPQ